MKLPELAVGIRVDLDAVGEAQEIVARLNEQVEGVKASIAALSAVPLSMDIVVNTVTVKDPEPTPEDEALRCAAGLKNYCVNVRQRECVNHMRNPIDCVFWRPNPYRNEGTGGHCMLQMSAPPKWELPDEPRS